MKMKLGGFVLVLALVARAEVASAAPGGRVRVLHTPIAVAEAGAPLRVEADVTDAFRATRIELRYRITGQPEFSSVAFAREAEGRYLAVVPGTAVAPPGLEYGIASVGEGGEAWHFASEGHPHPVVVRTSAEAARLREALGRVGGRRSRLQLAAEYVVFGARRRVAGEAKQDDLYTRLEADFTYRLLTPIVQHIRLGYGRMRGQTLNDTSDPEPGRDTGLDYGFAEVRFNATRNLFFDGRVLAGATETGFNGGARAALQIGADDATYVQLGAEVVGGVGQNGWVTLSWDTVPYVRMSTTVGVTTFPAPDGDGGLSLRYELEIPLGKDMTFAANVGYQARDERVGGLAGGARIGVAF
ncbi:MAG: hypothetical protein IT370_14130 [Deltaproteobacteria bacterium]|nr:hypothetical protein [Deltaproteobacteria bacterium]